MNKRHFKPGITLCDCGSVASKWKGDAPCCPRCDRRESIAHRDVAGFDPLRYEARLSVDAANGVPTMRDLTILEGAL